MSELRLASQRARATIRRRLANQRARATIRRRLASQRARATIRRRLSTVAARRKSQPRRWTDHKPAFVPYATSVKKRNASRLWRSQELRHLAAAATKSAERHPEFFQGPTGSPIASMATTCPSRDAACTSCAACLIARAITPASPATGVRGSRRTMPAAARTPRMAHRGKSTSSCSSRTSAGR
jgi:hypothetical protein